MTCEFTHEWVAWLIFAVLQLLYMKLEYYLGKTDKVKAGSLLELIYNLFILTKEKIWKNHLT
jgi:hypothetical protein